MKTVLSMNLFFLQIFAAAMLMLAPEQSAANEQQIKALIETNCVRCHRFSGKPVSKFDLKAPDLMWSGAKYQHKWLVSWLEGNEELLYPNRYRWDQPAEKAEKFEHMKLSHDEAELTARYMEKRFLDSRIKKKAIDLTRLTQREAEFGAEIYKKFSCIGCHQIKEGGKVTGGAISVNLYDAGNRYTLDWLYRFALNPQDFTPHSGEYLADLSPLGLRYLLGYLMTQGKSDYKFYEPWTSSYFKTAKAERGEKTYKTYCAQCHGPQGRGDGPGAAGLDPKPAAHATMPLADYPEDYLYNVIYYGGKSVGKSANMPDWGLTLPQPELADLIAYLRKTFTATAEGGK